VRKARVGRNPNKPETESSFRNELWSNSSLKDPEGKLKKIDLVPLQNKGGEAPPPAAT